MKFLNSRGITAIKEMGFDDFYGFTDILKELEESSDLSLRVNFMSQPVSEKMNIDYAKKMSALFTGDAIRFSGFNKMTDGSISEMKGDLKQPYTNNSEITNIEKIDWNEIERDLKIADNHGFRFSLHAQGDDIPESIFNACGGYFTDDSFQFNSNNCLNVSELIDAWTSGGAYNLGLEDKIGTLEAGKLADIVIYSDDLFSIPIKNVKQAKVVTTIYDGKIVFKDDSVIINSNTK